MSSHSNWFYVSDEQPIGPVSFQQLIENLKITRFESQLVWRNGLEDWIEARELPEFALFFLANRHRSGAELRRPVIAAAAAAAVQVETSGVAKFQPWRRFFGRARSV